MATDPDADRLQLAEKQKKFKLLIIYFYLIFLSGEWHVFTGNEMGTILTWWIWTNWRAANSNADLSNIYILNSAVSSQIVKTIADVEGSFLKCFKIFLENLFKLLCFLKKYLQYFIFYLGFRNKTTLTGFKWMGNVADELKSQGKTTILSWEESIGFMAGNTLDKDGVSAAAIFAEIANYLHVRENLKISDQLFKIYNKYYFRKQTLTIFLDMDFIWYEVLIGLYQLHL